MKIPRSFSLLTLMLITAIVAVSLVLISTRTELARAKSSVGELTEQIGIIQVSDPSQLHARQLHPIFPMTWSFQVFAPEGKSFALHIGEGVIDKETGYPRKIISGKINGSGQQGTVLLSLRRIHSGSNSGWILRNFGKFNAMGGTHTSDVERYSWLEQKMEHTLWNRDLHEPVRTFDTSTPVVLWKKSENDTSILDETPQVQLKDPRAFMIWLEPIAD